MLASVVAWPSHRPVETIGSHLANSRKCAAPPIAIILDFIRT